MRVSELKRILERMRDDDEVVIPIATMAGSVGPKPTVSVTSALQGNDWDRGKLMICTEAPLHIAGDVYAEEQKRARDKGEALAFIWMSCGSRSLDDKQKLAAIRRTIKRFGFTVAEDEALARAKGETE